MSVTTIEKTIAAIVARSLPLRVRREGILTLLPGKDGRYRLTPGDLDHGARVGTLARGLDGRRLPAGHALTIEEATRLVRELLGLDEPSLSSQSASPTSEDPERKEHLGVEFALDELSPVLWRWTIYRENSPAVPRSGEFIGTRQQAEAACIRAIDELLEQDAL
jgi:hypothetical protein